MFNNTIAMGTAPVRDRKTKDLTSTPTPDSQDATMRLEKANSDNCLYNEEEALALARSQPSSTDPVWVTFSPDDPDNPRNFPSWKKWYITVMVSWFNLMSSIAAGGYSSASSGIADEFHVSSEVSTVGFSMFIFGFAFGPLLWAPLSECYGRRPIYVVALFFLMIFELPIALAPNIGTVIVCRLLAGLGASVGIANAGGSISDLWARDENGYPMLCYALCSCITQLPLPATGYIALTLGWRWVFWFAMIVFAFFWVMTIVYLPETRHSTILERKAKRVRRLLIKEGFPDAPILEHISDAHSRGQNHSLHRLFAINLTKPFRFLVTEPITIGAAAYQGFIYAILFSFNESFPLVFGNNHHFNTGENGVAFLGVVIGSFLAAFLHPLQERYYRRRVSENSGKGVPEARMWLARFGAFLMPISLFWFAWTSYASVPWIVPIIASSFWGAGVLLVSLSILNYVVDSYQTYSASALAGANVVRNGIGAIFPLFTYYMYHNLGYEWAGSLVAFLSLLFVPIPTWWFYKGDTLRLNSPWARYDVSPSKMGVPVTSDADGQFSI